MNKKVIALFTAILMLYVSASHAYKREVTENKKENVKQSEAVPSEQKNEPAEAMTKDDYERAKSDANNDLIAGGVMVGVAAGLIGGGIGIKDGNGFGTRTIIGMTMVIAALPVAAGGIYWLIKGTAKRGMLKGKAVAVLPAIDPPSNSYGLNLAVKF